MVFNIILVNIEVAVYYKYYNKHRLLQYVFDSYLNYKMCFIFRTVPN